MRTYNIKWLRTQKIKNLPFYSEEIKSVKKVTKKSVILVFYLNYHFFLKNLKNYIINGYQIYYHSNQKETKRLTKHQILQNTLPLYDSVVISRREHAHKYYAETYNVKITDNKSLDDFDRIEDLYIDIAIYDPLAGSGYIQLPPELNKPKKGLINIKKIKMMNALNGVILDFLILKINILKE